MKNLQDIIDTFEDNTLTQWTHFEHAVICMYFAQKTTNIHALFGTIKCAFIRHRTLISKEYTLLKCTQKYHETKTWFWCNLFYTLVQKHQGKSLEEIVEIAREKGYLDSTYVYTFFTETELETDEARSTILPKTITYA